MIGKWLLHGVEIGVTAFGAVGAFFAGFCAVCAVVALIGALIQAGNRE